MLAASRLLRSLSTATLSALSSAAATSCRCRPRPSASVADVVAILGPADQLVSLATLARRKLKSFAKRPGFEAAVAHSCFCKSGFLSDLHVSNILLSMYVQGGDFVASRQLFRERPDRDLVSWCTMISSHVSCDRFDDALSIFCKMWEEDVRPNRHVLSSVLRACAGSGFSGCGAMVHGLVVKTGLVCDHFVDVGFVDMYAKCGKVGDAVRWFYEVPVKSIVIWNAMLTGFVWNDMMVDAVEFYCEMCRLGMIMDIVTLRIVAYAAAVTELVEFCASLHASAVKYKLSTDRYFVSELVRLYGDVGNIEYMGKLFCSVKFPDTSLCALAIAGYTLYGHQEEAASLVRKLLSLKLDAKEGDLITVLGTCVVKEEISQIHSYATKTGHLEYNSVSNALITLYSKFGAMCDAESVFQMMRTHNVISWTAIAAGYSQNLQFDKALLYLKNISKLGFHRDPHYFTTMLGACAWLQDITIGKQIHSLVVKCGYLLSDFVTSSLIDMYMRCPSIEDAVGLYLSSVSPKGLALTNVMLSGYIWNSLPKEALRLFCSNYKSGLIPDVVTYSTVLGACADIGAKEAGEQLHCCLVKCGFEHADVVIENAAVNLYVKCDCISSACLFFHSMKHWNRNSYAMLMLGYIQNNCTAEALKLFADMQKSGLHADPVTFARILRGCADLSAIELGRQVHASVLKTGLISETYVERALVGIYRESDIASNLIRTPAEMPVNYNEALQSFEKHDLHYETKENTLEPIGLFELKESKDQKELQTVFPCAASHILGRPLYADFVFSIVRTPEKRLAVANEERWHLNDCIVSCLEKDSFENVNMITPLLMDAISLSPYVLVVFSQSIQPEAMNEWHHLQRPLGRSSSLLSTALVAPR